MIKRLLKTIPAIFLSFVLLASSALALNTVNLSPEYFANPTIGRPIANAQIYVGVVDLDPEVPANQKQLSVLQENGTVVAVPQPIATGAGGVPEYNGSPVTLLVDGSYSIKVNDNLGSQLYYVPKNAELEALSSIDSIADLRAITTTPADGDVFSVLGYYTPGDGGGGQFYWDAASVLADNNGTIIKVASITTGRWIRLFTLPALAEWYGAKGDNNGTAGNGTDDIIAIQAAVDNHIEVELLDKFYRVSDTLDVLNPNQIIKGRGGSLSGAATWLIPDASLSGFVVEQESVGGVTISDFAIEGNDSANSLGGVYLKSPGSANRGNIVKSLQIRGFKKDNAYGLLNESYASTLDTIFAGNILRGTGIKLGGIGITGTTTTIIKPYLSSCDTGISISNTNLGITIYDPIFESCVNEYVQTSGQVTMIEPYFENINRLNNDGVNRTSLVQPLIGGVAAKYSMFCAGETLNIVGGQLSNLNSDADSHIMYVAADSIVNITGMNYNDRLLFAGSIDTDPAADLYMENCSQINFDLMPNKSNQSSPTIWANKHKKQYLQGALLPTINAAASGIILDGFTIDINTLYTFQVVTITNNVIRSVEELYVEASGGGGEAIIQYNKYTHTTYTSVYSLVNVVGNTVDIQALNNGPVSQKYTISLIDSVRTQ